MDVSSQCYGCVTKINVSFEEEDLSNLTASLKGIVRPETQEISSTFRGTGNRW